MHSKFLLAMSGHNTKFELSEKGIRKAITSFTNVRNNSIIKMTIGKHPRDNERVGTPIVLMGSDHSQKKRQRTLSEDGETSANENNSCNSNTVTSCKNDVKNTMIGNGSFSNETSSYSPRMMALLTSLEALDDHEQRGTHSQWPFTSSKTPPATPFIPPPSSNQAAAALLQQRILGQPLTARPAIHKIEELPPPGSSNAQTSTAVVHAVSRDSLNKSPTVNARALDTIKRAVAAATAMSKFENASASHNTVNAAFEQQRIAGAAALAAVAAQSGSSFRHTPTIASSIVGTQNVPLGSFAFPNIPTNATSDTANTKYNAAHLHHGNRPLSIQGPTARQMAIHTAVHSDYKKIYKPLQRPPRLPTPHEALVIAAISTAAPVAPVCR